MGDQGPAAPLGCRSSTRPVGFEDPAMKSVPVARSLPVQPFQEPPRRLRQAGDPDFYDSDDDGTMPVVQGGAGNRAMHSNEEAEKAAMDAAWDSAEASEQEILEIEVSAEGAEADDLFARWVAEEEAAERKRKKKAKKSRKTKIPVGDVDVSLFFKLPLAEAGKRLRWLKENSAEYEAAWYKGQVLPRETWQWANEAAKAYMTGRDSAPPLPSSPPPRSRSSSPPPPMPDAPPVPEKRKERVSRLDAMTSLLAHLQQKCAAAVAQGRQDKSTESRILRLEAVMKQNHESAGGQATDDAPKMTMAEFRAQKDTHFVASVPEKKKITVTDYYQSRKNITPKTPELYLEDGSPVDYVPPSTSGIDPEVMTPLVYHRPLLHYQGKDPFAVRRYRPPLRLFKDAKEVGKTMKIRFDIYPGKRDTINEYSEYPKPKNQSPVVDILAFWNPLTPQAPKSPRDPRLLDETALLELEGDRKRAPAVRRDPLRGVKAAAAAVQVPKAGKRKRRGQKSGNKKGTVSLDRAAMISGPELLGLISRRGEVVFHGVNPQTFAKHRRDDVTEGKKNATSKTLRRIRTRARKKRVERGEIPYYRTRPDRPDTREVTLMPAGGTIGGDPDGLTMISEESLEEGEIA